MRPPQENDVFHAIAHPARRRMLVLLKQGERAAGALAEPFGMSLPAVSQHLKVLKEAALVSERREGRQRIYRLLPQPLRAVVSWARELDLVWSHRLDAPEAHLDQKHGRRRP
jgi:DNA-binding transcriptional ArsR family regulator